MCVHVHVRVYMFCWCSSFVTPVVRYGATHGISCCRLFLPLLLPHVNFTTSILYGSESVCNVNYQRVPALQKTDVLLALTVGQMKNCDLRVIFSIDMWQVSKHTNESL